jgi:hypothetical protein
VKLRRDDSAVLAVLREHPRFTVFDVDDKLARTLERLTATRRLVHHNDQEAYPWCRVEVLPPSERCATCGGSGGIATGLRGRWKHRQCGECGGSGYVPVSSPPAPSLAPTTDKD